MKCLDKKRIKMKQGETLALNERIMLSLVSTGVSLAILAPNLASRVLACGEVEKSCGLWGVLEGVRSVFSQGYDVV